MSEFEQGLANVMGSFISTELDYIEKSSNELEEVTKEKDLYKQALLDIKGYIEKNYETHWQSDMLMEIKDMINKSLGSDSNDIW